MEGACGREGTLQMGESGGGRSADWRTGGLISAETSFSPVTAFVFTRAAFKSNEGRPASGLTLGFRREI